VLARPIPPVVVWTPVTRSIPSVEWTRLAQIPAVAQTHSQWIPSVEWIPVALIPAVAQTHSQWIP
jgi:hypothetical protein